MRGLTMNALYMSPDVTCVGELLGSIPVRLTATGMVLSVLLLLPSWPAALLPQQ
jgi:cbb3-type cytochrome oxidase subunit 1